MSTNTQIRYSYTNHRYETVYHSVVVHGRLTRLQLDQIQRSLYQGRFFVPALIGLPADKENGYGGYVDTVWEPWCRLDMADIGPTEAEATSDLPAETVAERFWHLTGHWREKIDKSALEPAGQLLGDDKKKGAKS